MPGEENQMSGRRVPEPHGVGRLIRPGARFDMDRLILPVATKQVIKDALHFIEHRAEIDDLFHLAEIEPMAQKCVLNFFGPPGTGKTMAARTIARTLGQPLYQVDYASVISCMVGQTAKSIKAAFKEARAEGAVLFWDEADALMSKRITADNVNAGTGVNQNRNVLMQELDRHDGIVIMATNLFSNYDDAMVRRIAEHIKFELPTLDERVQLFELHMPFTDRMDRIDISELARHCANFSGGDILNVAMNSVRAACRGDDNRRWMITQDVVLKQISRIKLAKREQANSAQEQIVE